MSPFPPEDLQPISRSDLATEHLDDWRFVDGQLCGRFATPSYAAGLALVAQLGEEAERSQHHPDVDLRYGHVDVRMNSHDVRAITQRDVRLARAISVIAAGVGAIAEPAEIGETSETAG